MPSTVVHLAIGALLAASLLNDGFDARALGIVLAVTAVPDLDTFIGLVAPGAHRAALHTLFIPILGTGLLAYDLTREDSWLRARGPRAIRIASVSLLAYLFAGIGPDLFLNGVNLFYPLHDQFIELNGRVVLSNQRGFVQTIYEPAKSTVGTTETVHYSTGINPTRGTEPKNVERVFPIARTGLQLLLILAALAVTTIRLWWNACWSSARKS